MENPIKMDDLGVPLFSETSIFDVVQYENMTINYHTCDPPIPQDMHIYTLRKLISSNMA